MPACAARPVATMMDMGVAKPNAQGQAMIKTLMTAINPLDIAGAGPMRLHVTKAMSADNNTRGTKILATLSTKD